MADTLAQSYYDFLTRAGFQPEFTAEGHVAFQHQGGHFYFLFDAQDPQFFRLVYPNFHALDSEALRARILRAASRVAETIKAAKIIVVEQNVWACVELFVVSAAHAETCLHAAMASIVGAVQRFEQELQQG